MSNRLSVCLDLPALLHRLQYMDGVWPFEFEYLCPADTIMKNCKIYLKLFVIHYLHESLILFLLYRTLDFSHFLENAFKWSDAQMQCF